MIKSNLKKVISAILASGTICSVGSPVLANHRWSCRSGKMIKKINKITYQDHNVTKLQEQIIEAIQKNDLNMLIQLSLCDKNFFSITIPVDCLKNKSDYAIFSCLSVDDNFFRTFSLLDLAIVNDSIDCFKFLLLNGATTALPNPNDIFLYAVYSGNFEIIKALEEQGNYFDKEDKDFMYLSASRVFTDNDDSLLYLLNSFLDNERINSLESYEAERLLAILLICEQKLLDIDEDKKLSIYKKIISFCEKKEICLTEEVGILIDKIFSSEDSTINIAAIIMQLPETELKLYTSTKQKLNEYIEKNKKLDQNFEAKLYSSMIKNFFHSTKDIPMMEKLEKLIEKSGCTEKLDFGKRAIGSAIRMKNEELTAGLIKFGADPINSCLYDYTPIMFAISSGSKGIVDLLIKNGANINTPANSFFGPPVLECFSHNSPNLKDSDMLQFLINRGANIKKKLSGGHTYLHSARNLDNVKVLVENGIDINAKNNYGETALSRFAYDGNHKVIEFLISKGAQVNTSDNNGNTPLHRACDNNGGPHNGDDDLHNEITRDFNVKAVETLIKSGTDVNAKNNNGDTPLHIASMNANERVIDLLLKNGADPHATNNDGATSFLVFGTKNN